MTYQTIEQQSEGLLNLLKSYAYEVWEVEDIYDEYFLCLNLDAHIWVDEDDTDMITICENEDTGEFEIHFCGDNDQVNYELGVYSPEEINFDLLEKAFDWAESQGRVLY